MKSCLTPLAALSAALLLAPGPSRAETRACTAITSLPATLGAPGVYCMNADLASGATTGRAITLAADGIVLDCNGYKLGGLAAGAQTQAIGIGSSQPLQLATVRNCNVRGFRHGIVLEGYGVVVADNRMDGNIGTAIHVHGEQARVERNRVLDTGALGKAVGIRLNGSGELRENTVSGVEAGGAYLAAGIELEGGGPVVSTGNRVRRVNASESKDTPSPAAMNIIGTIQLVMDGDNFVGPGLGNGIKCDQPISLMQTGVVLAGFSPSMTGCGSQSD